MMNSHKNQSNPKRIRILFLETAGFLFANKTNRTEINIYATDLFIL